MDWIILGIGEVARKFALDLRQVGHGVSAVASRNPDKARAFVESLGLEAKSGGYDAALRSKGDAVYIATPPSSHEALALAAIAAGYGVLIEKPFALDAASARRIANAARARDVFAMEAMWTRFQPLIGAVRDRIEMGDLGEIRGMDGRFLLPNISDETVSLFDLNMGGGALMHRGVYVLSLARYLLGPIMDMSTAARIGDTGVDEDSVVVLRHSSGALTSLRASLRSGGGPEETVIWGTTGSLVLEGPIYRPVRARITPVHARPATGGGQPRRAEAFRESSLGLWLSRRLNGLRARRSVRTISAPFAGNGYHYQAQAVAEALARKETEHPLMPLAESIEILDLIDQIRAEWKS